MEIKRILVPVDFSHFSDLALEFAIEIARKFNSTLVLFHALLLFEEEGEEEQRMLEYRRWLDEREQRLINEMESNKQKTRANGIQTEIEVQRGFSSADVILDYLHTNPFDLVIMGTHGRTGLKHLLLGSVAEKTGRLSPVPVLTVHRSFHKKQINKILVPVDFSPNSKTAVDQAVYWAQKFDAGIEFLHVIEQEIHPSFYAAGVSSIFQIDTGLKKRVLENLHEFVADQMPPDLPADFQVKEGKSHKEIVDYAAESKTDLIVISSHGLSALDYVLMGSTTEKVIRWAKCPVLTLKTNKPV